MPNHYNITTPDFDSALNRAPSPVDNATILDFTLKLEFIAVDAQTAKDLRGKVFRMQPWTDGAVRQYIADFIDSVEQHVSDRIYILFLSQKGDVSVEIGKFANVNRKMPIPATPLGHSAR